MTGHEDLDRTLAGWFEADAISPAPENTLERVVDATRRRRPLPMWLAGQGSHWVREAPKAGSLPVFGLRWSTAVVLLLALVALVGGAILIGARLSQTPRLPTGDLGRLAYGLDGDIYVADWDGSNPVRIVDGSPSTGDRGDCGQYGGEGPMWSPDGRYLAYRSDWDDVCEGSVYISDPQGRVVTSFPGVGWLIPWSPDSTRVATQVMLDKTVGVYGLDGVRQALLDESRMCCGDYDPQWSPDGESLLIPSGPGQWELPLDGSAPRALRADDPRSNRRVAFSADGAQAAFITASDELVVVSADGSGQRVLTSGGLEFSPLWSPLGDRIAFFAERDPIGAPEKFDLGLVDVASGAVTWLTSVSATGPMIPGFSSDGKRILVTKPDVDDTQSLWSVNTDGSGSQLLVRGSDWGDWQ